MTQLAQIRLVLRVDVLSVEQINEFGRIAEKVALLVGQEVYHEDIKIDVLLENGSLITKITVIGTVLLASYQGVPAIKDKLDKLCQGASSYGIMFKDNFLAQAGVPDKNVIKFTTSAGTPQKIKRLIEKVEKLEREKPSLDQLATARQRFDAIVRDMSETEANNLKTLLEFHHVPPPTKWPKKPTQKTKSPKRLKMKSSPLSGTELLQKTPSAPTAYKPTPRLRHHNVISIPARR